MKQQNYWYFLSLFSLFIFFLGKILFSKEVLYQIYNTNFVILATGFLVIGNIIEYINKREAKE